MNFILAASSPQTGNNIINTDLYFRSLRLQLMEIKELIVFLRRAAYIVQEMIPVSFFLLHTVFLKKNILVFKDIQLVIT